MQNRRWTIPHHYWAGLYWVSMGVASILLNAAVALPALAYAPEPELMQLKGYSPEVVSTAQDQRKRQEWRQLGVQTMTPMERFWHNIMYNNWTGSVDPFGSQILRERQ